VSVALSLSRNRILMRKNFIASLLFTLTALCTTPCSYAQTGKAEKLRMQVYGGEKEDSTHIMRILLLANEYESINADSVMKLSREAYRLSVKHEFPKGVANAYEMTGSAHSMFGNSDSAMHYYRLSLAYAAKYNLHQILASKYNHIANVYFMTGKYPDAHTYYDSAIKYAEANKNIDLEAKANSNLASVYYKMGNYSRALTYYLRGLKVQERLGVAEDIASDLGNIANVYYRLGMYSNAVAYTDRAMKLHMKTGKTEQVIGALTTYALIYNDQKKYDSALHYLEQGLKLATEMNSPFLQNIMIGNMAEAYLKKSAYAKAGELYTTSLEMSQKLGDAEGLAFAQAGVGAVWLKQGNITGGRQYLVAALDMMQKMGIQEQALDIASRLAKSYELSGDYEKAYHFLQVENSISDSLKKEKAQEEVRQLIFNYDMQKKEDEISLLQKDNAIIEEKNRNQKILLWGFLAGFIATGIAAYFMFRNIKRIRESRKLIEQQAKKLAELNEFKDNTFSVLAHDLRSPVNALTSTMMLLDEEVISPSEFAVYKQELNNKLQSVSILLDNMLHWAQSQMKGEHTLDIERINIKRKVLKSISVLGDAARQKGINIHSDVPAEIWARGDKNHIDIIVRNLVSNAIKFTHEGGDIRITAETEGTITSIHIADNGVGMTPEQLNHLLDRDIYLSTTGTEGEKGTGLGLALCFDLVKKNHGDIKVSSSPGKGSVFTIILPSAI